MLMPRRALAGLVVPAAVIILGLASAPARAERLVAVAPLSTLGTEDTSAQVKKLTTQIETAVAGLPGTKIVSAAQVTEAIRRAKRPQLKACEGEAACLTELGKLVGAQVVIAGEIGGLGDAKVVYLGATDVGAGKELRSTTLTVGGARADDTPQAAVVRLLEPDRYRGTVRFATDVSGATIYVNGSKIAPSPKGEVTLPVGTQAVRVTHPEYHDFVRFVDVAYGKSTEVAVTMQQYPIVRRDLQGKPINRDQIIYDDPPLWRRWYVVAPAAVGLAILTGIVVSAIVHAPYKTDACAKVGDKDGC
jgi:PEGA domain